MIDLSIVIVSWNVCHLLRRCLLSILESGGADGGGTQYEGPFRFQIVVVDNDSSDGSVQMVQDEFPGVQLVENHSNPGFAAANNQGIARAQGRYLLLLNPDTEVLDASLSSLMEFADANPAVGLIGPELLNTDGSVQSSRRRFPTIITAIFESTWLEPWAPRCVLGRFFVHDRSDDVVQDVDWVQGAALFTRREVVEQVGGMDERFFMYSEELDWCRRIKAAGWRIVYYPEATILHRGGKSSDQVVAARHVYFQTSKILYYRKYYGPLVSELLRIFLLGNYVCQLGLESVKWLVGHRRPLRSERIAAYRRVLRSGLRGHSPG